MSQSEFVTAPVGQKEAEQLSAEQFKVIMLLALAVFLDGFDSQILPLSIPLMMEGWSVERAALAPVMAWSLAGVGIGAGLAGILADKAGRRQTLIACVALFGLATLACTAAPDLNTLSALRFISGLGLGGALPIAASLAAEFSPLSRRGSVTAYVMVGMPLGAFAAGLVAAVVLKRLGWESLFVIGGVAPMLLGFALIYLLPESPEYRVLQERQKNGVTEERTRLLELLFNKAIALDTVLIWSGFFLVLLALYTMVSWTPAMLVGAGADLAATSLSLAVFSIGGIFGAVVAGWSLAKWGSRSSMLLFCAAAVVTCGFMVVVGPGPGMFLVFVVLLGCLGLILSALQTGLYAVASNAYPTASRSTGIGSASAVGRVGAVCSAFVGAAALDIGGSRLFLLVVGLILVVAFFALAVLRRHVPAAGSKK